MKLRSPMLLLCLLATFLCAASSPANGSVGYTLDAVGNRLSRLSTLNFVPTNSATYTTNDWLASDMVDNNGNTTASALGNDVYDSENRLVHRTTTLNSQLSTISILYDGDGNRVRKSVTDGTNTVTTWYLVDDRNPTGYAQVLEEHVSLNSQPPALNRVYTYGHDLLTQDRLAGAGWQASHYGYDGHGSVRFLTDAAGQVTDSYEYDAFGKLIARTPNSELQTPNLYLYAGEQWDADLGLYYNRARYLNPDTGRFWNMDTFEGNAEDPLSLHKYLYAHNNPVNGCDPSGHEFSLGGLSISMAIGNSLHSMYDGGVSTVGSAMQASIFGVQAGKGMNDVLTGYVLDETGISTLIDAYKFVGSYFTDPEEAELAEDILWMSEVIVNYAYAVMDSEGSGDFYLDFNPQCFLAGTPVLTDRGLKPIEAIRPGDFVWAWNKETDSAVLRPVVQTFVRQREDVRKLCAGTDTLKVTGEHPFYLKDKGWTPAKNIQVGDRIVTFDHSTVTVEAHDPCPGQWKVYNFEVETDHNYYVGYESILTHNRNNSVFRRKVLGNFKNYDAHHIVAKASQYWAAKESRKILRRLGVGIDTRVNGVPLPRNLKARKELGVTTTAHHGMGVHSHETMQAVLDRVKIALDRDELKGILKDISAEIGNGTFSGIRIRK